MATLKRSRRDPDRVEGDIVAVREASSSLRPEQSRKRARTSLEGRDKDQPPQRAESRSSEDEDNSASDEDENGPDTPPQTQYELKRDAGFRHLRHTDHDDQLATQKLMQRPETLGDNMVAESGIIESITCYNFMCHERLNVEFGPLINFVVGENGSGKSAVLTALTLCLGGKASDTNRGGSLRSFVKEGQEHGNLVVKIKNAGTDAYQPDLYGDFIIVERHFSKSGSSGFKIKSSTGRVISTKKQEVDEISEWYALQIGNPLTVLSQDNARQFLNAASPAQKYKYFVSGVQLEQLDNDYKMSQDTLDKTLLLRDDLDGKIEDVRKEKEIAERLAETASKNQNLREKARHYRNQLVWSQVVEQERSLEEITASLARRDERIAQAEEDCEEMGKALANVEEKLERVKAARDNLNSDRDSFESNLAEAKGNYEAAKKDISALLVEERDAHSRLRTIKTDISECETKIKAEEQRLGESTGAARSGKDAELSQARKDERDLLSQITESNEQVPALQTDLASAEGRLKGLQQSKELKRTDLESARRRLRDLEGNAGSAHSGFDPELQNLARVVSQSREFDTKPIGPIGANIRLLKPEWSGILEKTFGEALNAFVVTSKRDQMRLSELIRRQRMARSPPVYIAYGGRIDTRNQEPDDRFDTILRVLEFDNELIRSQLIINNQIEKILLVNQRKDAEDIMTQERPPRNVAACICFHDGRNKRGHGLRITNRNGSMGSTPIRPNQQRPRMQSDSGRQAAVEKENMAQLEVEYRELGGEERQAQQALQRQRQGLEAQRRSTKNLEADLRRKQADIEHIQEELDSFEGVDGRLVVLRSELESKREEEESIGGQYGHIKISKRDLNAKVDGEKQKYEAIKLECEDFEARLNKAIEKIQSHESMRRVAVSKKNEAHERADIERNERRRSEEKQQRKEAEVEEFIVQARGMAPDRVHIPDGETYKSIEKKYEKVREQLAQREERLGATDQQIYDRASEAKARYEDVEKQAHDIDETIKSLKGAIEHRLHLWRTFQRQISARIRIQFNYLLSERGYRGKIDLDHRARKVLIHIEPDETKKSSAGRSTKSLSGGEKSFSSICMLLSIWEAIGSPIRCLDEFDVFMDNVNRAIATNMLVDAARRSVSRQYILITPNAIEGRARLDKDVKVIRLTDPRQRTLI